MSVRSRKQPVLGYAINYRKEHGEWRHLDTDPLIETTWLDSLVCGSNYSLYMTAYNHIGPSLPSTIVSARTIGRGAFKEIHHGFIIKISPFQCRMSLIYPI